MVPTVFLDYCVLNDSLRDAAVLAKLRRLRKEGAELYTSTTVIGEAIEVLAEGPLEGQYMFIDLIRDLKVNFLHPRREWLKVQAELDRFLDEKNAQYVPSSERAHLAMAMAHRMDIYVTSRPEARTLNGIIGLEKMITIIDVDRSLEHLQIK
ncbi:MAG TPA: hypothetical protein VLH13_02040 [Methanomassiliicoccales archaeon]|nr:hypothetical protein [Methanomassiliicoccales archaeon]